MTEAEWLEDKDTDSVAPIQYILAALNLERAAPAKEDTEGQGSERRKVLLFLVAASRRFMPLLTPAYRDAIEEAERQADIASGRRFPSDAYQRADEEWRATDKGMRIRPYRAEVYFTICAVAGIAYPNWPLLDVCGHMAQNLCFAAGEMVQPVQDRAGRPMTSHEITNRDESMRRETANQIALVREIFGNPFHPITFASSWRTSTAVTLASQMYKSRDFSAMPILADALQDAGCDSADVLDHCRGPGPHVRGCWVVDLVLGKE